MPLRKLKKVKEVMEPSREDRVVVTRDAKPAAVLSVSAGGKNWERMLFFRFISVFLSDSDQSSWSNLTHSPPQPILAFSLVDLQETTSEPGIGVAEYCLMIHQWRLLLRSRRDSQRSEVMLWVM
jgi:hypothetical protein